MARVSNLSRGTGLRKKANPNESKRVVDELERGSYNSDDIDWILPQYDEEISSERPKHGDVPDAN